MGKRTAHLLALILTSALFACRAPAQTNATTNQTSGETVSNGEITELLGSIRDLKAQVRDLGNQLHEVSADQREAKSEAQQLRQQLELATQRIRLLENGGGAKDASAPATVSAVSVAPASTASSVATSSVAAQQTPTQSETVEKKVADLDDSLQLLDAKVADQYQTKVESGAKYRLRLSGIFLFNLYGNAGYVDNQDFPVLAGGSSPFDTGRAFGGSLRQSQIGIQGFGPDFAGAHTSASLRFDFAGNQQQDPNGAVLGGVRLRTGTFRMDWENTSLIAGQDTLFFVPLTPSSLASLAVPALSYAGNLWGWTPQVRVEHKIVLANRSELHLAFGILDQITGDVPVSTGQERYASWGEQSGQPGYATHIGWQKKIPAGTVSIGAGGYYGRQSWAFGRMTDSWAGTLDLQVPVTRFLEFSSAYYRGRAIGGFGGGIGQSVAFSGPFTSPTSSVHGLNSQGGWAQITLKPRTNFRINGAFGQDNPFASQFRTFPVVLSYYDDTYVKNQTWFVNGIYQLRSNILFSLEYRRLLSRDTDPANYFANNVNLSLGYLF